MKSIGLDDVSDGMVSSEESLVIDMVRSKFPNLDLRRGTVLRDLLVSADAAVGAAFRAQAQEQESRSSLLRMSEAEAAGESIDPEDVSAVLSNFNVEPVAGTKATGFVRMSMSSDRMYQVMEGSVFTTLDGLAFEATETVVASSDPSDGGGAPLETGAKGTWFLVPVRCLSQGSAGNIPQGTYLTPGFDLFGFVSASAYRTFSGGSDMETLERTVARIRQALSVRGLLTKASTEAVLRDRFDGTDNPIVAVSTCGYGSASQRRDKHNVFGVAVGGRVDVYVRNFTGLPVAHVTKEGVRADDGSYLVSVSPEEVPGMCCVRRVSDPESDSLMSYRHEDSWTDGGSSSTWHDFDVSGGVSELMGTVWRGVDITVHPGDGDGGSGSRLFRVEFVALPAARELQALVDGPSVRSSGTDYVVRCPVVVQVSVYAVVRHPYGRAFDAVAARDKVCEYINTSGFPGRLTRSEISSVLIGLGATSVDLPGSDSMLHGFGYAADGTEFRLSGDALDLADAVPGERMMVSRETGVFVVEPDNVVIRAVEE